MPEKSEPSVMDLPDNDGPATPAQVQPDTVPANLFGQWAKFADGQEGIVVGEGGPDAMLLVQIGDTVVGQHRSNVVEVSTANFTVA